MGIFLITLLLILLLWPSIKIWLRRFAANKTEDFLRTATGMPPRPGSRQAKRESRRENNNNYRNSSNGYYYRAGRRQRQPEPAGPIIPKEYAEDVEFVEIKEFSQTTIHASVDYGNKKEWHESQVTDVEWEEITYTSNTNKRKSR